MFDASPFNRLPAVSALYLSLLRSGYDFFATTALPSLAFLAAVLHFVSNQGRGFRYHPDPAVYGKHAGRLCFLAFCLAAYLTAEPPARSVGPYLAIGIRGFLAMTIVQGAAVLILTGIAEIRSLASARSRSLRQRLAQFRDRLWPAPIPEPPAPPPPPPPPPSFQATVDQIRQEYEATCQTIRSAGLDRDERRAALQFARQKYLRRLHEVMRR